jgi:hypothetical protein
MAHQIWAGLILLILVSAVPAFAQSDCAGGIVTDDGTFENGLGALSSAPSSEYVMRVTPPPGLQRLERVCVC